MGSGYKDGITASSVFLFVGWCFLIVGSAEPFARWIIKRTPEGKPISRVFTIFISGAVLLSVILTDNAGINYLYGPFLLGLALPDGPPVGSTLVEKLETITCGLLTPLMVTFCSMKVNLIVLYDLDFIWRVWALIAVCLVMKFSAVLFPALMCKVPLKDALSFSFIMCTQGVVQMAFYFTFSIAQVFDGETLSMVTISVFLIAAGTQLSVKSLYDYSRIYTGYHKRDIQHLAYNAELRVLTCAHRLDDALAVRKILEASFPNKESPLAVYALNLVELVGRASPLLIDHQPGQKTSSGVSCSQKIIEVFHIF